MLSAMCANRRPIEGVLLDSGGTLVGPIGGRWNPRFDFEEVLARHAPSADPARFAEAFAAGDRFLADAANTTPPRHDYHRVILAELGVEPTEALLGELDLPLEHPVVEPFPEVPVVLAALHAAGIRMAIVTDSWGTGQGVVERTRAIGLVGIELAIVSEELGSLKPDPRMYRAASEGLGLDPPLCLFVDDDPDLVRAAIALGYQGVAICRGDAPVPVDGTPWLRTLDGVLDLVGAR
jgi:putative hydrolase of the HAD superfamily